MPKIFDELERERNLQNAREAQTSARDIGAIPDPVNPDRRESTRRNLRLYLETYFAKTFRLGWSEYHLLLIKAIERAVWEGGRQAIGYPRGSGKTSICERSVLWATGHGHARYPMVFCAEERKSDQRLAAIKMELLTNELLLEDFPEVCYPIVKSEGIAMRAQHQISCGQKTHLRWTASEVQFSSLPANEAARNAGSCIGVGTITGSASRGPNITLPTGGTMRPDLLLVDDPQTRASAKSPLQNQERLDTICGDMLGMAGPDVQIAALLTGTPIYCDDLVDRILDREHFPDWRGIRVSMVEEMPTNMDLWDAWNDIRTEQSDDALQKCHAFYLENREAMDAGCQVYWEARVYDGYASAIETAMFLRYSSPATFMSEYQCQPEDRIESEITIPSVEELALRTSGADRGKLPIQTQHLTAFVDVQQGQLWYLVAGWQENFTGFIIDYATWPDQRRRYYTKMDSRRQFQAELPGAGFDAALANALEKLILGELSKSWIREDGAELRIGKGFIDANWGDSTDVIYTFLHRHKLAPVWMPSHGQPLTALQDLSEKKKGPGERIGLNWRTSIHPKWRIERLLHDVNWWKTFVAHRWLTAVGDPGALYIPSGDDPRMLLDHMHSEYAKKTELRGKERIQWDLKPNRDNEFWDGIVGCAVGASMLGCKLADITQSPSVRRRQRITSENIGEFYQ